MDFDPERIGRSVREHRKKAELTQAELAERAGLAFETVSRVESGSEPPSLRTVMKLADALGATLDAVVGRIPSTTTGSASASLPRTDPDLRRLVDALRRVQPRLRRHLLPLARALANGRKPAARPKGPK